ncbi:MAG: adenylyl-sulfate kinase [Kofleriaceae bacterium]
MTTRGVVVWFTGLPASGKTTLAEAVRDRVGPARPCLVLDSDAVREALGAAGYADRERDAFYGALGRLAALIAEQGQVVLVAATAPRRAHREAARRVAPAFVEVWVEASLAQCEARDPKGLYARARAGEAPALPGLGAPYEPPRAPEVTASGGRDAAAIDRIAGLIDALSD